METGRQVFLSSIVVTLRGSEGVSSMAQRGRGDSRGQIRDASGSLPPLLMWLSRDGILMPGVESDSKDLRRVVWGVMTTSCCIGPSKQDDRRPA